MGGSGSKQMSQQEMMNLQFNLKYTAKQLSKSHKKAEKEEAQERKKVKQALEKGNVDGARIYASNAIRKKNEGLNYLRLSARLDAVASKVDQAAKTQQVMRQMGAVTKGLDGILKSMDPVKIATVMDQFETQLEGLDVTTGYMDQAIGGATALTTPEDQVMGLMAQIADENNLELGAQLGGDAAVGKQALPAAEQAQVDDLSERLAKLQAGKAG